MLHVFLSKPLAKAHSVEEEGVEHGVTGLLAELADLHHHGAGEVVT